MPSNPRLTNALAVFGAALEADRLAQAYLLVGNVRDEGVPFAEAALSRLFCQGMSKPCGECSACTRIRQRTHPDVAWIEPEKKSRTVGIDRIRELQRLVYQTTLSGSWRAVLLIGADRLGSDAANAFLKTLEEPPPRTLFLLVSDSPQGILATIQSRCQRVVLSTGQEGLPEPWQAQLIEILAAPVENSLIGRLTSGTMFLELLEDIRKNVKQEEEARVGNTEIDDETLDARIEARYRGLRAMAVRTMLFWHRDILMSVCGADASLLHHPEHADTIAALAKGLEYRAAIRNIDVIESMQRRFDRNMTQDAVVQAAMNGLVFQRGIRV